MDSFGIIRLLLGYLVLRFRCTVLAGDTGGASADPGATGIDLNIRKKKSTREYIYTKSAGIGTFTPRQGFLFKAVYVGEKLIWRADDEGKWSKKVLLDGTGLFSETKNVTVHTGDGDIKLFRLTESTWGETHSVSYQSSQDESKDETQDEPHGEPRDESQDDVSESAAASETAHSDPGSLSQEPPDPSDSQQPSSAPTSSSGSFCLSDLKLIAPGDSGAGGAFQMDETHYEVEESASSLIFRIYPGVKCVMVNYQGDEVWKHDGAMSHPSRIVFYKLSRRIVLRFEKQFITCRKERSRWVCRLYDYKFMHSPEDSTAAAGVLSRHKIGLFTSVDFGYRGVRELYFSEYSLKDTENLIVCHLNGDVECKLIRYKGEDVWRFEDKKPKTITYFKNTERFVVRFEEGFDVSKNVDGKWMTTHHSFDSPFATTQTASASPSDETEDQKAHGSETEEPPESDVVEESDASGFPEPDAPE